MGKQALDFLIASSGSRVNLEVDFFGGEPLMNWQVVKDLVAYARTQEPIHHKKLFSMKARINEWLRTALIMLGESIKLREM